MRRVVGRPVVRIADNVARETHIESQPSVMAMVAHELRAPMTALHSAAELLERDFDVLAPEAQRTMVSTIHRGAIWMRELLDNMLCDAAIREGRLRVMARSLDIRTAIAEIEDLVQPLLRQKGQRLVVRMDPILPLVAGDQHRIAQVLLNLVTNAHKYAARGTEITVAATGGPRRVRVNVLDEGPGIPEESVRTIFHAYDRAGRTGGDGLGIGLWVARALVEAHGGRVGAANRRGSGAVVWFELPAITWAPRVSANDTIVARVG